MQWITLAYFFYLITCHTQESLADRLPPQDRDQTTSGNYIIKNCERINRSQHLHQFLPEVWQGLQLVLSDLELGTASRHGFSTFFKSNINRPIARHVYRAIANGTDLPTGKPIIECTSPDMGYSEELYRVFLWLCSPRPPSFKRNQAAAIVDQGTVILCPAFWDFVDFPGIDDCVSVGGRRGRKRFLDSGGTLVDTKYSVLLHELMHLYNPFDGANKTDEVYDIQGCADLDKIKSVANAENWAYYADSVRSGCTRFPPIPVPDELK
ncbi:MAG: hypothetical protein LQ343_000801 [Gyalolechia ehrenbergii]|nr:MAG: hypothetical protein LQ343_000801 [Gyalolechia ehrenbergii]